MSPPSSLSDRPTYSQSQIHEYFNYISFPSLAQQHIPDIHEKGQEQHALELLRLLQIHHLSSIPFENLSLHYSAHHTISIDADGLYDKFVGNNRGRGGYCMENNCFLGTVLRSLGFEVYSAGARVCEDGVNYAPWSHMINILTLADGSKVILDVGFGADGPTRPLPLLEGTVSRGIAPQELRLVRENIPANTDPRQRLWIYKTRHTPQDSWNPRYCFSEVEFLPQDYAMMNFYTSQCKFCWFTYKIVVVKMIREGDEIIGTMILNGDVVKRRIRGETEELKRCGTEGERVQALERWFGIALTAEERRGITGMVTDLGDGQ